MGKAAVIPLLVPRSAAGATPLPSAIGHQAAQAELNAAIFPHYLLGRQLALEQTVRELVLLLTPEQRHTLVDRLRFDADLSMQRLQAGIADERDDAATCGYICCLLQQGA